MGSSSWVINLYTALIHMAAIWLRKTWGGGAAAERETQIKRIENAVSWQVAL